MRPRGHIVLLGGAGGDVRAFPPALLRDQHSLTLSVRSILDHIGDRIETLARAEAVFGWLRDGTVVPKPFHAFPLERALDAHTFLESRPSMGKILLVQPSRLRKNPRAVSNPPVPPKASGPIRTPRVFPQPA